MDSDIKQSEFIVVGSGPGGATVAKELSKRKKKVLILEWGDNASLTGSFWQGVKTLLFPGRGLLFTPQMLGLVRGITTGGSTIHYYATSFPVPFDILKAYGIDIRTEVKELREELPVAPLKDDMVGPMSNRIIQSANDLGYNWKKLDKFMYQDRWEPGYKFGHYGDPHGVKWNARMYIEEALANGAKLINGAKVKKVLFCMRLFGYSRSLGSAANYDHYRTWKTPCQVSCRRNRVKLELSHFPRIFCVKFHNIHS
jgi:choline dehydrogenase-like flavoprotein